MAEFGLFLIDRVPAPPDLAQLAEQNLAVDDGVRGELLQRLVEEIAPLILRHRRQDRLAARRAVKTVGVALARAHSGGPGRLDHFDVKDAASLAATQIHRLVERLVQPLHRARRRRGQRILTGVLGTDVPDAWSEEISADFALIEHVSEIFERP